MEKLELQKIANEVRKDIVTALHSAKAGHPGGSLSAADVFTYLYFEEMNIDPKDPKKADRDRFVLSKGHTAPGYYSALAERGFFPKEDLKTLRHLGSYLQGHPDMKHIDKVIDSLGIREKLSYYPDELSGGQRQRVAIARALASKPALLLADEPTGNLDDKTSNEVMNLLKESAKEFHQTIILVTHDPQIADMADKVITISDGNLVSIQDN